MNRACFIFPLCSLFNFWQSNNGHKVLHTRFRFWIVLSLLTPRETFVLSDNHREWNKQGTLLILLFVKFNVEEEEGDAPCAFSSFRRRRGVGIAVIQGNKFRSSHFDLVLTLSRRPLVD